MGFGSSISERNTVNCKILAAAVWTAAALLPAVRLGAQAVGALPAPTTRRGPEVPQKILEKNPEFQRLLDPPTGEEFLRSYSQGYRDKSAEIEAKAANLSDQNLRARYRGDEWSYVPKKTLNLYKAQADAAFYQEKISFLREHREAWFEIGQVKYDDVIKALLVKPLPGAATRTNLRLVVSPDKMNQIYEQFRKVADAEIDEKTRNYVSQAAAGSMCAGNREWCYSAKRDEVEQSARAARMILVGQGDLEAKKIDRLVLVDYVTETVFQEFDPHLSAADTLVWRLSTAVPPMIPPEPPAGAAQTQNTMDAAVEGAPALGPLADGRESASNTQSSLFSAKPTVRRPVKVTPAAIIDQPPPRYPEAARAKNVQGKIILGATIGKDGAVFGVRVLSGDDELAPAAVEAVSHWKYKPMLVDGEPTETETTVTITFSLSE